MARVIARLALLLAAVPAAAQEAPGWSFRITPYVWAPSMDTTVAIGRDPPAESSTSVLEILEGALLLTGEARRGDLALLGEFNYLNLGDRAEGPRGFFGADLDLEGVMASLAIALTVAEGEGWRVEALGGARLWSLDASVDFDRLAAQSTSRDWIDPILGARASYALTPSLFAEGLGTVGGFGVGSDVQWELVGRIGWKITDTFTAAAGYRHLALEFDDDDLVLDLTLTGPFIALDVTF